MSGARDPVWTLYRTLLAYSAFAILIFGAGALEYVHFEPFGEPDTVHARIVGVYSYDPTTHTTSGSNRERFARNEQFAAVVDWTVLGDYQPLTVEAIWYDSFENIVGSVGPGSPDDLRDQTIVPAVVPQGLKLHLPGDYIFAIEKLDNGLPVAVLDRRLVYVERG